MIRITFLALSLLLSVTSVSAISFRLNDWTYEVRNNTRNKTSLYKGRFENLTHKKDKSFVLKLDKQEGKVWLRVEKDGHNEWVELYRKVEFNDGRLLYFKDGQIETTHNRFRLRFMKGNEINCILEDTYLGQIWRMQKDKNGDLYFKLHINQ